MSDQIFGIIFKIANTFHGWWFDLLWTTNSYRNQTKIRWRQQWRQMLEQVWWQLSIAADDVDHQYDVQCLLELQRTRGKTPRVNFSKAKRQQHKQQPWLSQSEQVRADALVFSRKILSIDKKHVRCRLKLKTFPTIFALISTFECLSRLMCCKSATKKDLQSPSY